MPAHRHHEPSDLPRRLPSTGSPARRLLALAVSLLVHAAVAGVLLLVVMVTVVEPPEPVLVPDAVLAETPGAPVRLPTSEFAEPAAPRAEFVPRQPLPAPPELELSLPDRVARPLDAAPPAGAFLDVAPTPADADPAASSFFGTGGNAHHVVYVIDRSGSMVVGTFARVRDELLRSIGRLDPGQDFHVILFAEGAPIEPAPRRLVPATSRNKVAVARFLLEDVRAEGRTDPVPALLRAFDVLADAGPDPGKLVYLLTDGLFPDREAVLAALRRDADGRVAVNTILFESPLHTPGEIDPAVAVMRQIAERTGGRFRLVRRVE